MRKAKCRKQKAKTTAATHSRVVRFHIKFYTDFTYRSKLQLKTSIRKQDETYICSSFSFRVAVAEEKGKSRCRVLTLQLSIFKDQESQTGFNN